MIETSSESQITLLKFLLFQPMDEEGDMNFHINGFCQDLTKPYLRLTSVSQSFLYFHALLSDRLCAIFLKSAFCLAETRHVASSFEPVVPGS